MLTDEEAITRMEQLARELAEWIAEMTPAAGPIESDIGARMMMLMSCEMLMQQGARCARHVHDAIVEMANDPVRRGARRTLAREARDDFPKDLVADELSPLLRAKGHLVRVGGSRG